MLLDLIDLRPGAWCAANLGGPLLIFSYTLVISCMLLPEYILYLQGLDWS